MSGNKKKENVMTENIIRAILALDRTISHRDSSRDILNKDYPGDKLSIDKYRMYKERLKRIDEVFVTAGI